MQNLNKRGNIPAIILSISAIVIVAVILMFVFVPSFIESFQKEPTITTTPTPTGALAIGKSASYKFNVWDLAQSAQTAVTSHTYYVWLQRAGTSGWKLATNAGTGATTGATSITSASTGDKLKVVTFTTGAGGYYGIPKEIDVVKEQDTFDVYTYRSVSSIPKMELYDSGAKLAGSNQNLTIGTDATDAFDKLLIEINSTNRAYRLNSIMFDVNLSSGSNVSKIEVATGKVIRSTRSATRIEEGVDGIKSISSVTLSEGTAPKRSGLRSLVDFTFDLSEPVLLLQYDTFETGNIVITTSGGACGTGSGEYIGLIIADSDYYVGTDNSLKFGRETDASSPADVGGLDFDITDIGCTA